MFAKSVIGFLLVGLTQRGVHGQDGYLDVADIVQAWNATTSSVMEGNGAYTAPDGTAVVVISRDCTVTSYNPTGGLQWTYQPDGDTECFGGVFFSYEGASKYMAFSVVSGGSR